MTDRNTVEVTTASGTLRGLRTQDVAMFRGIPYAAPPIGPLRFKAPQPLAPWRGVRDALEYGPQSIQTSADLALMGAPEVIGLMFEPPEQCANSEDCLYLNVWTPASSGKRPVMVWCHSGGFFSGSGAAAHCEGSRLSARADVVVVTVNHRLGLFGFLHLAELAGEEYADAGNAGLLDLVAALTWIRDNIAAFGGDPENLTIFGESGGGAKVGALMSMPRARALFHRAIVQSGPWARYREANDGTQVAIEVLQRLGLDPRRPSGLAGIPAELISQVQHVTMRSLMGRPAAADGPMADQHIGPVLDGRVLPYQPWSKQAVAVSAHVPLLIGSTRDEGTFFLSADPGLSTLDWDGLRARALGLLGDKADSVLAAYREADPAASPADLMVRLITDKIVRIPSIRQAESRLKPGVAPVYMYLFEYETDILGGRLRAPHGLEIPFAFDNAGTDPYAGTDPRRFDLAARVSGLWASFARTGTPAHADVPPWPAYEPEQRSTMVLNLASRVVHDPERERRIIWQKH
jgi:para-nitrobenzyl esterase